MTRPSLTSTQRGAALLAHRQQAGVSQKRLSKALAAHLGNPWRPGRAATISHIEAGRRYISEERLELLIGLIRQLAAAQAAGSPNGGEGPETAGTSRPVARTAPADDGTVA